MTHNHLLNAFEKTSHFITVIEKSIKTIISQGEITELTDSHYPVLQNKFANLQIFLQILAAQIERNLQNWDTFSVLAPTLMGVYYLRLFVTPHPHSTPTPTHVLHL